MNDNSKCGPQAEIKLTVEKVAPIWTRNFILLGSVNLLTMMMVHVLLPILPLYLVEIGGSPKDVGYVMGSMTVGALAIRLFAGRLVDTYGRKKFLLLGMVLTAATAILYKYAALVLLLVLLRGFHGLAFGLTSTAISTMVADDLPKTRMGEGMGYFGLTNSVSMGLAPLIGLWLVKISGYSLFFNIITILAVASLGCSFFIQGTEIPARKPDSLTTSFWSRFLEKKAVPASAVMFFVACVHGAVIFFISLHASALSVTNIGPFFTASAVMMFVSRPLAGRWSDAGKSNLILFSGLMSLGISLVVIGMSHTVIGFSVAGLFFGYGFGAAVPTLQAMAVRNVTPHRRGAAIATFFSTFDLGIFLSSVIWGLVATAAGFKFIFFTALIPLAVAGAISYGYLKTAPTAAQNS